MHRPPPPAPKRRSLVLPLLLILACVGLAAAVAHKRVRRLQIEGSRPPEVELLVNVSTQVMSFRVGEEIKLEDPLEPRHTILMNVPPQKPPAPIIHSTPARTIEMARKESAETPSSSQTNAPVAAGKPQEIVSE